MRYTPILLLLVGLFAFDTNAQERVVTAGIQFKPMLPPGFFNAESAQEVINNVEFKTDQEFGYAAGMVIRWGFTRSISLETGINFVRRNYRVSVDSLNNNFKTEIDYRIIGYEIPITGLIYVQLSRQWYMNASFGACIDMFPRKIYTDANDGYQYRTERKSLIQLAVLANLGFEFRTEKSGYFYIGSSFHRPFDDLYLTGIGEDDAINAISVQALNGTYLTLDLRYFFHEDPQKKKNRKKK